MLVAVQLTRKYRRDTSSNFCNRFYMYCMMASTGVCFTMYGVCGTREQNQKDMVLQTSISENCRSNTRVYSTCFAIHRTSSSIVQALTNSECKLKHGSDSSLAMLDQPKIMEILSRSVSNGSTLWVDGHREGKNFYFRNNRLISNPAITDENSDYGCASLIMRNGTASLAAISCYTDLTGYICQYPLTNLS